MRNIFIKFSLVLFVILFSACESDEAKTIVEDKQSFEELKALGNKNYSLLTTDGKKIEFKIENEKLISKELNGKNVLINFWATWCPPCKKEIPAFNTLYEKYPENFEIIGVLFEKDKDPQELRSFLNELNVKFPITVGPENFRLAKLFDDVQKIPESFLYDKNGNFIKKYIGEVNQEDLETLIK